MTRPSFLERLDIVAHWTGVPALTEYPPRRRPLRWPAMVALLLAYGGYGVAAAHGMRGPVAMLGYGAEMLGFATGSFVQILSPLKPFGAAEEADEWDRAIRARAYLVTFAVFAVTTFAALGGVIAAAALQWSPAALAQGGAQTLFLLFTILSAMPAAHASWTVRWQRGDDDHTG